MENLDSTLSQEENFSPHDAEFTKQDRANLKSAGVWSMVAGILFFVWTLVYIFFMYSMMSNPMFSGGFGGMPPALNTIKNMTLFFFVLIIISLIVIGVLFVLFSLKTMGLNDVIKKDQVSEVFTSLKKLFAGAGIVFIITQLFTLIYISSIMGGYMNMMSRGMF